MRVLLITELYPSGPSDGPTVISHALRNVFREWVFSESVSVEVVIPRVFGLRRFLKELPPRVTTNQIDGIRVVSFRLFKIPIWNRVVTYRRVLRYLATKKGAVDVLVSHMPHGNKLGSVMRNILGVPLVMGIHQSDLKHMSEDSSIYVRADGLVWRSPSMRRLGREYVTPEREITAVSGVDPRWIRGSGRSNFPSDLRFLTVARLHPLKNIDVTIRALASIPSRHIWRYTIIGNGPEFQRLKQLAVSLGVDDRIEIKGELPHEECMVQMDNADVFVMVSAPETFGLVYVEAMSRGMIIIGARGWGIDGVAKQEEEALFCVARDEDDLREKITSLWHRDLAAMSAKAVQKARSLSGPECSETYFKFVRGLVASINDS